MNNLDPKGAIGATKTPLHLLPPVAMEAWAWAQKDGADRYKPYNWRSVQVCATTYISAMMRHLDAFRDGEDRTKDSKVFHLGAIMANCAILLDAAAAGTLVDDRFKMPERGECLIHRSPEENCPDCGAAHETAQQIDKLTKALKTAYGLITRHHEVGVMQEPGCLCPVCHRDGKEPEMDQIIEALRSVERGDK